MRPILKRTSFLSCLIGALASAGMAQKRLTWSDFSMSVTSRHTIRMVLPDATAIEGQPTEITSDGIEMRITKTSNRQAHPKGAASIPRASVSLVEVRTPRSLGKCIGTLAPIGVGITLAATAFGRGDDTYTRLIAGGLTMIGGGAGGFFVGRAIDRRFERVVITGDK